MHLRAGVYFFASSSLLSACDLSVGLCHWGNRQGAAKLNSFDVLGHIKVVGSKQLH